MGEEWAARFARAFMLDTIATLHASGFPFVISTPEPDAKEFELLGVPRVDQGAGDLGERLQMVLARGLEQHAWVAAIGADSPGLPLSLLRSACSAPYASIVPTHDGGFAFLLLRRCPTGLFAGIPWSTATTCDAMKARMRAAGMQVQVLPTWFDIDHLHDLSFLDGVPLQSAPQSHLIWSQMRDDAASCKTETLEEA